MIVDSLMRLNTDELSPKQWRKLFSRLRYMDDDQNIYEPWMIYPHKHLVKIPRGAWNHIPGSVTYYDRRVTAASSPYDFTGELDSPGFDGQKHCVEIMVEQEQGIVVAQPGWGKTNVALAFAAKSGQRTLVLVHTEDILQQWVKRAEDVIPDAKIGVIRGKADLMGDVVISTVQTFRRRLRVDPSYQHMFGAVILDEAHHAPAATFDEILNEMPAKYRFGFTATDKRADGRHPYMTTVLGPVIYRSKFESKVPVHVVPVKSHKFYYGYRGAWDWRNLINALKNDEKRNQTIAQLAAAEIQDGNSVLVLSREIDHLEMIQDELHLEFKHDEGWTQRIEILAAAKRSKAERERILDDFRAGKILCILATQLADEALDVPILSRVFLTFPGKHDGRIIQQVGRALREHPEKFDAVIYDVVDDRVGVLRRQWMQRKQAYKKMKISVRKLRVK